MAQGAVGNLPLAGTNVNGVPQVVNPQENEFQRESHFLAFIGSYIPESANSISAYYATIDPYNTKPTFPQWLVNAGFIKTTGQWHTRGKQIIACDLGPINGCDMRAHDASGNLVYGDNVINTDSHAIVLNAADLGFVRNQFIRCIDPANPKSTSPCTAKNPIIYTYLENYPVVPFATDSGFPGNSGYPSQNDAARAMNSAINRPSGNDANTANPPQSIARFADVAFEWAPPAKNPTSSTRFGQLYAYEVGSDDALGNVPELLNFRDKDFTPPGSTSGIINFVKADGSKNPILAGDKFAPNLDGAGNKYHPGNCLICHGGAPAFVPTGGPYPRAGNINGFRFLPLDIVNLLFTSDHASGDPLSRASQECQIKEYNKAVLLTVPKYAETDDQGVIRVPHLREVIQGWYTDPGGPLFGRATQKSDFLPIGWRDVNNGGTLPAGVSDLYKEVVGPSCRSCHFNRELSLDFGTYANFHQESDLQQLTFLGSCKQNSDAGPNAKFMPLALLTFIRFWQTQTQPQTLPPLGDGPFNVRLDHAVDQLARDFHFSSVDGYCRTKP